MKYQPKTQYKKKSIQIFLEEFFQISLMNPYIVTLNLALLRWNKRRTQKLVVPRELTSRHGIIRFICIRNSLLLEVIAYLQCEMCKRLNVDWAFEMHVMFSRIPIANCVYRIGARRLWALLHQRFISNSLVALSA